MSPSTQDLLGNKGDLSRAVPNESCIRPKAVGDGRWKWPIRPEASDTAGSIRPGVYDRMYDSGSKAGSIILGCLPTEGRQA